jgi:hypothetical protein
VPPTLSNNKTTMSISISGTVHLPRLPLRPILGRTPAAAPLQCLPTPATASAPYLPTCRIYPSQVTLPRWCCTSQVPMPAPTSQLLSPTRALPGQEAPVKFDGHVIPIEEAEHVYAIFVGRWVTGAWEPGGS